MINFIYIFTFVIFRGSAIAKIVGQNVVEKSDIFETRVNMYMYEENFEGRKLTEVVNEKHENVKYLPGVKLPENVVAMPDLVEACKGADILIFVMPHQFVRQTCKTMQEHIKDSALAVSLIKGFDKAPDGKPGIAMISNMIEEILGIDCAVLMGANLAPEVADEQFCEATIGCKNLAEGEILKNLFEKPYFRCSICMDVETIEMCGALKNVVGIGAGIVDGMGLGHNTKAAVIRLGLMEMVKFGEMFIKGSQEVTFFESCGVADLVATCHGGRNRMLGELVIKSDKDRPNWTIKDLEKEILRGQSFQGPLVAQEIHEVLKERGIVDDFPLFNAIYRICQREIPPSDFIDCLRSHPEHMD
ncbi:glycerol-3-phosphate dehydrogenase [NAD(+)], cytoplasmic-like isoform X1 [Ruditapes philippinarum]|uniref:glycerol-3-phosphate dehydrogenase [NAD(+)], cytoplasmic-like isoform X1 n=1 Tax=Ruditapes philippinarum TaxID=129788 RepID=UPI00295C36A3|nr:glycerol-3-phosphate dehydrogenase [NAD(+)], cytoplasmic-like isoform X1 [Ruditapes philippinarum]